MMMTRDAYRRIAPLILLFGTVWPVAALAQPQEPPRFTAGVELARLDIEVVDANGRPVRDLRPEEVEVMEDGVRRPVTFLQHVSEPTGSYAEAARRTVGAGVSTNQGAPRGRLYVLVFDQTHMAPRNEAPARRAAERFLRARMRPGDRVALFALPGPGARIGFTADINRVIAELDSISGTRQRTIFTDIGEIRGFEAYEINRGNQEVLQRVLLRLIEERGGARFGGVQITSMDVMDSSRGVVSREDARARQFLDTLADLLLALQRIEGRKEVILLSEGFYDDNVGRDLERVAAAAAQSYSMVYALDLNRSEADIQEFTSLGAQRFSAIQSRVSPLGALAAETDGELFTYASRRLDEVLGRIAGRAGDYYIVAFEPAEGGTADPADYRRVEVTVSRPGARVSTRTGYAVGGAPTAADRRQAIDAALTAPFALQGLPMEYTTYLLRGETSEAPRVVLSLAAELPIAAARQNAPADVVFVVRDARTGQAVASGTDIIALPTTPLPGATSGRGTYQVQFEAPPGSYLMRAVVREPGGQIGSADRRFDVRPVGGSGVSATDLMMGSSADPLPVRATAFTEDGLSGVVELYGEPAALEEADVELRLSASGDVETATTVSADLLEITDDGTDARRTARIELPLADLPPGRYVAHVDVRRAGEVIGQLRRELDVVAGSRPASEPESATVVDASEILRGQLAATYLAALGDTTVRDGVAEALARARGDDWSGVDALLGEPAGAAGDDAGVVELALRGMARFAAGDYASAATALEAAFAAGTDPPRQARTGFFLGWAYAYQGDDRRAASAWRRAVFLDATLVPAHLALADAYLRMSQPALAAQVLQAGLEALPDSPELRDRLSRLVR